MSYEAGPYNSDDGRGGRRGGSGRQARGRDDDRDSRDRDDRRGSGSRGDRRDGDRGGGGGGGPKDGGGGRGGGRATDDRRSDARDRDHGRDVDDWHERAGLDGYQKGNTPSAGRRSNGSGSRGSSRDVPSLAAVATSSNSNELVKRVEALEEQVVQLKSQNRMFLAFMKKTEERLKDLKSERANGGSTPRDKARPPPRDEAGGGRGMGARQPSAAAMAEERPRSARDRNDNDDEEEREKEKKKRAIQRTNLLRKKKQDQQRHQEASEPEEAREEPPAQQKRRAPPPSKKPAPKSQPPPKYESDDDDDRGGDAGQERGLGGGGNNIYAQAALDPSAFPEGEEAPADPDSLEACPNCERKFAPKVLQRHLAKQVCKKKPRKEFKVERVEADAVQAAKQAPKENAKKKPKKADWRQERARLQEAIKAGKQMSKALKEGKNLADLPPPPASSMPDDRVPCPHCGRKFAENAAERHIPHCAETKNRPAPAGRGRAPPKRGTRR